jgi:hypothetical protein
MFTDTDKDILERDLIWFWLEQTGINIDELELQQAIDMLKTEFTSNASDCEIPIGDHILSIVPSDMLPIIPGSDEDPVNSVKQWLGVDNIVQWDGYGAFSLFYLGW